MDAKVRIIRRWRIESPTSRRPLVFSIRHFSLIISGAWRSKAMAAACFLTPACGRPLPVGARWKIRSTDAGVVEPCAFFRLAFFRVVRPVRGSKSFECSCVSLSVISAISVVQFSAFAPRGAFIVSTVRGLTSIIVPGWNELEITRHCVAALKRHTREPWDLIVVDNGRGRTAFFAEGRSLRVFRVPSPWFIPAPCHGILNKSPWLARRAFTQGLRGILMAVQCPYCRHELGLKTAPPGMYTSACPDCGRKFYLAVPEDPQQSPVAAPDPGGT